MKIKRFIGQTAQEAIQKVKDEMGKDAIILNTRNIPKKGWSRWFSKPLVEVMAAIDELSLMRDYLPLKQPDFRPLQQHTDNTVALERLENRIETITGMIKKLAEKTGSVENKSNISEMGEYGLYYKQLIKAEVHEDIARMLIERANELHRNGHPDFSLCLEKLMLQILGRPQTFSALPGERRIVLFVGPTGVGKTTTLAKLAAVFAIQQKRQVGLITSDTYRIAAADQLRIYADILGIPLMVVYSPKEMKGALSVYADKDVVLVDTAGKSQKDKTQQKEIEEIIAISQATDIYIAISSNTSYSGYMNIINNYKFIADYKLIFTKMDEAAAYGIILNCCCMAGKQLSYMTTGQNVPDDFELIDPNKVVNNLMGRIKL